MAFTPIFLGFIACVSIFTFTYNVKDLNPVYSLQAFSKEETQTKNIVRTISEFANRHNRKLSSAYDLFLPNAVVDLTAAGSPGPMVVEAWRPFQQYLWDDVLMNEVWVFPNAVVEFIGQRNATVITGFALGITYYGPQYIASELFPAGTGGSVARFTLYTPDDTDWFFTSITIRRQATLVTFSQTESGGLNITFTKRGHIQTRDADENARYYYSIYIVALLAAGKSQMADAVMQTPEYVRLFV